MQITRVFIFYLVHHFSSHIKMCVICDNKLRAPNCETVHQYNCELCMCVMTFSSVYLSEIVLIFNSLYLLQSYQHCLLCCRNDPNSPYLISHVFDAL